MVQTRHVERTQFMIGRQNAGKSTQLKSMFQHKRFGTGGIIPDRMPPNRTYIIGKDRALYIRSTSPQEWERLENGRAVSRSLQRHHAKITVGFPILGISPAHCKTTPSTKCQAQPE